MTSEMSTNSGSMKNNQRFHPVNGLKVPVNARVKAKNAGAITARSMNCRSDQKSLLEISVESLSNPQANSQAAALVTKTPNGKTAEEVDNRLNKYTASAKHNATAAKTRRLGEIHCQFIKKRPSPIIAKTRGSIFLKRMH